jgi:hypothetical protein
MRRAIATFGLGFALIAAVAAVTLAKAPPRLVRIGAPGVPGVNANGANALFSTTGYHTVCQAHEVLPAGISDFRVGIWAFYGSRLRVAAYEGSRLLTEGTRNASWTATSATVPVKPLAHQAPDATVCVAIGPTSEPMLLLGGHTSSAQGATLTAGGIPRGGAVKGGGQSLQGRESIEYLAPGRRSWWSQALSVARRLGLGRAFSGMWIALLIAALMAAVAVLAVRLALQELR